MRIELGGPEIFDNLPVYEGILPDMTHPVSTPSMIHRPSRRMLVESAIERLASPIWRILYTFTG